MSFQCVECHRDVNGFTGHLTADLCERCSSARSVKPVDTICLCGNPVSDEGRCTFVGSELKHLARCNGILCERLANSDRALRLCFSDYNRVRFELMALKKGLRGLWLK